MAALYVVLARCLVFRGVATLITVVKATLSLVNLRFYGIIQG